MFRPAALVGIYDHGETIADVVTPLVARGLECWIVDDGSHARTRAQIDALAQSCRDVHVERLPENRGRGAALIHGFERLSRAGFTHALVLDADGQHDPADAERFLDEARHDPDALVLGDPIFGDDAPWVRLQGRRISRFWVHVETRSRAIRDPLCGYRCYPLESTLAITRRCRVGMRMDFDPEIAVRLFWAGAPIVIVPTRIRYPENGLSHFRMVRDNVRISWMHTRLVFGMLVRRLARAATASGTSTSWTHIEERGSIVGMRFVAWCLRLLGRRAAGWLCEPILAYFFVTGRTARTASRRYLARVAAIPEGRRALGRNADLWASWLHFRTFGQGILDLAGAWSAGERGVQVTFPERAEFQRIAASGSGAVLLGAHLGSFDVLGALSTKKGVRVNMLVFQRNARKINAVMKSLAPESGLRTIEVEPGSIQYVLDLQACITRGEIVALLGDRVELASEKRVARLNFLGDEAPFPLGPLWIAYLLECPVYLIFALRRGSGAYEICLERFAERIEIDRTRRDEDLTAWLERYVRRLEAQCLAAPLEWSNFYDFWHDEEPKPRPTDITRGVASQDTRSRDVSPA
jgi:predicted LPLAT superfamily acyltransferase/glycosyltransferase involved in cell wall biosynthesis